MVCVCVCMKVCDGVRMCVWRSVIDGVCYGLCDGVCICEGVCIVYVWRYVIVCVLYLGYVHMGVDARAFVYHIELKEHINCPALSLSTLFICNMVF